MLKAAGIGVYEEVLVANVTNGERVETYVVPAPAGSKDIVVLVRLQGISVPAIL
jgi:aspartate 1-decarboxylase